MRDLLGAAEWDEPSPPDAVTADWAAGERDWLVRAGILSEDTPAAAATCDACGFDHVEPVQWVGGPGLDQRPFLTCPWAGAIRLDPQSLRRWRVSLPGLARAVAVALGAAGEPTPRIPGRVWKLGTVRGGGVASVGILAVGLTRPDGPTLIERVGELRAANSLVLVPARIPPPASWGSARPPAVTPLGDVLSLASSGFVVQWDVLAAAVTPAVRRAAKGPARAFPTPTGTTWEQVSVTVGDLRVTVRAGDVVRSFGFAEAGFEDRRERGKPDEVWTLLRTLARHRGVLGPTDAVLTKENTVKQGMSRLRASLRALVGLDHDPFHPTRRGKPYRTRFAVTSSDPTAFPTPPGVGWDALTLTEVTPGVIEAAVGVEGRDVTLVPADDDGGSGRWEGVTTAADRRRRFTLAELGLILTAGGPEAAGEALLAALRAGGRLTRPADDPSLLALGDALTRFFGIGDAPFEFAPRRGEWVTRFEAASVVRPSDR